MRRRWMLVVIALGLLGVGPDRLAAQGDDACPVLVDAALAATGEVCAGLGRNAACYGHDRVEAIPRAEDGALVFAAPADRVPLAALSSLRTAALDETTQEWGVAVLNVQANLPDTLPGQAVTLLLMGDASLADATVENDATPEGTTSPMQAITFHSGLGGTTCQEAAGSLLIQSPDGQAVALNINGMDVQLGSTALFTTVPTEDGEALVASLVEGHLWLRSAGRALTLAESGAAVAITLNAQGRVDAASRLRDPRPLLAAAGRALPGAAACRMLTPLLRPTFDPEACGIDLRFSVPEGALDDGWQPGDLLPGGILPDGISPDSILPATLQPGSLLPGLLPGSVRPTRPGSLRPPPPAPTAPPLLAPLQTLVPILPVPGF